MPRRSRSVKTSVNYDDDDHGYDDDFTPYASIAYVPKWKPAAQGCYDDDPWRDESDDEAPDESERALAWAERESWREEQRIRRLEAAGKIADAWLRYREQRRTLANVRAVLMCLKQLGRSDDGMIEREVLPRALKR
jgi:hypothetical protein